MSSNETTKLIIGITTSLFVGATAMILISMEFFSTYMIAVVIPIIAYVISVLMSIVYQYSTCGAVQIPTILISDLLVGATNGLASFLLSMESIPFLKNIYGTYAPRNPVTGFPYLENSPEYMAAMVNENHYKVQFLTGMVKAIVPVYLSEPVKNGFVYLYWTFWMTLLPLYFVLSVQGLCSSK